jgi:hypothetical protein
MAIKREISWLDRGGAEAAGKMSYILILRVLIDIMYANLRYYVF